MDDKLKTEIVKVYQTSRNSIQDIARIYRVDVHEVMEAIGEKKATNVQMEGDLISTEEAGPNAQMNYGKQVKVPITTN